MGNDRLIPPPEGYDIEVVEGVVPPPPEGFDVAVGDSVAILAPEIGDSFSIKDRLPEDVFTEEERSEAANSMYLSQVLGPGWEDVAALQDILLKQLYDEPMTAKTGFGRLKQSWQTGKMQIDLARLRLAQMKGDTSKSTQNHIDHVKARMPPPDALAKERSIPEKFLKATAEMLPLPIRGITEGAKYGLPAGAAAAAIAFAAGQAGPQIAIPEEIVTVPAAFLTWTGIGLTYGATKFISEIEAGLAYDEILSFEDDYGNKIDPAIAANVAASIGIINGLLELAQIRTFLETIPGARTLIRKAVNDTIKKVLTSGSLKAILARAVGKYGVFMATEVAQELAQESVTISFGEFSKVLNNYLKDSDIPPTTQEEIINRLVETGKQSAMAFALMGLPGPVVGVGIEAKRLPAAVKVAPEAVRPVETPIAPPKAPEAVVEPVVAREVKVPVEVAKPPIEPPAIKPVEPVSEKMTVSDIMVEAERIEPVEPVEIITEPGKVVVGVTVFTTVAQGQKLYKTEAIAKTAQGYENKIAKLKTQIKEAKAKAKTKIAHELDVVKAKTQQKLDKIEARYEKIITHIKAVIARQKEVKALRERIKKLATKIAKAPGLSVDFYYREAIENLQFGIDPHFRTKKTMRMREKTREFLKRKPEALKDIPVKLMRKINAKNIADYTVEELEEIAKEIDRLTKLGKLKRKLKLKQEKKEIEDQRDEIIQNVIKGKPLDITKRPIVLSTTKEGIITKIKRVAARPFSLTPPRIFDTIDGGLGTFRGIMHRVFYDQVSKQQDIELVAIDKRKQKGMARLRELDITLGDLAQTRAIDGVEFTVDETIGIYTAEKNPAAQLAVMYGNEISESLIAEVIDSLSVNEKLWGDFIISEYEEHYSELRQTVIESENKDMGYEENYTPIRRQGIDYKTSSEEIKAQLLMRKHFRKGYAAHGFDIRRKDIPAEFQRPINLRVTEVWLGEIAKQEHYISFGKLVKQLHRIADNREFRQAITSNFGEDYHTAIRHYIDRVANPRVYRSFGAIENASRTLRGNVVVAYLAYNLLVIGKQIPSLALYLGKIGPGALISSIGEFAADPLTMMEKVAELDPQVKFIMLEREMEEIRSIVERGEYSKIIKTVGVNGMLGIRYVDKIVRTIGWNAIYEKMIANNASEAEAIREAQHITLRTQVGGFAKDVAELYATNEYLNWFLMFTSQLNKIYNITTYDTFAYWRNEEYRRAALTMTGVGIASVFIWMIVHKRLPEDEDDIAEAFIEQAVNAVPLVGRAISSGVKGWGDDSPPPFKAAKDLGRIYSAKDKEKAALKALESGAALGGVPVTAIKRGIKFAETRELIELIGGKPER